MRQAHRFLRVIVVVALLVTGGAANALYYCDVPGYEREALLQFYRDTTVGTKWINAGGWGTTNPVCTWNGIVCFQSYDKYQPCVSAVKEINLAGQRLVGPADPNGALNFTALPRLQAVRLQNNGIRGIFPSFPLGINVIFLHDNQLDGAFPDLSYYLGLSLFVVTKNRLKGAVGPLPPFITEFFVDTNELDGPLPQPPSSLFNVPGQVKLCGNSFDRNPDPTHAQWDIDWQRLNKPVLSSQFYDPPCRSE